MADIPCMVIMCVYIYVCMFIMYISQEKDILVRMYIHINIYIQHISQIKDSDFPKHKSQGKNGDFEWYRAMVVDRLDEGRRCVCVCVCVCGWVGGRDGCG